MTKKLTIATRGSKLALTQSAWVGDRLAELEPGLEVDLLRVVTTGDKIQDVPLAQVGGKGLFVKEIEEAILDGRAQVAVHSIKDVPAELPPGLHLAAVPVREDVRDAFISADGSGLDQLPKGAKVGTSSLRRSAQLLSYRPDLNIVPLRGNVDTRLRRLEEGLVAAIVLAAAGLNRLGLGDRVTEYLDPSVMLPAVGQGALGVECRIDDGPTNELLARFDDWETKVRVTAERAFLARLEGGCQVPLACLAQVEGRRLIMNGLVAALDGRRIIRCRAIGSVDAAAEIGRSLAQSILGRGGEEILEEVYNQ